MQHKHPPLYSTLLLASLLTGCSDSDSQSDGSIERPTAVVASITATWEGSSVSFVSTENPEQFEQGFAEHLHSDIGVATHGDHFYLVSKYGKDSIAKYAFANPGKPVWEFSTNDADEYSNPYDIVFASEDQAYVLRYGASELWEVNPSVSQSADDFVTDQIDLSAYATDSVPEMAAALLHDGLLYVALQNQEFWTPQTAYLVIIDTATNTETADSGIALPIKNPTDIERLDNTLYISGVGIYEFVDFSTGDVITPAEYSGGIVKVPLDTLTPEIIVDDGDQATHLYGQFTEMALVSPTLGFFTGFEGFQDETLYAFNPSTGDVAGSFSSDLEGKDIQSIAVDSEQRLWVGIGDFSAPEIRIFDAVTKEALYTVPVRDNPAQITFSDEPNLASD